MPTNNPRSANGHRRRQLRARVLAEEDTCHLCLLPVDTSLPAGRPDSPEVDELLPVSLGGDPLDRSNVRLAHRICNQHRGAKELHRLNRPADVRPVKPIRTSRAW